MAQDEKYPLALPQGTILAGQYVIERVLGQGGFGITYKATDHKTGESVAVKEFFPDSMATRTTANTVSAFSGERGESFGYGKECFLQEAEMLAKFIGKENIVRVYSYFEENGTAYFVMEFVEGTSFARYIKEQGGKVSYGEAEKILLPIIDALAAVHAKGIVHRDVTPDNIYITKDGKVKLLDFGAARYSLGDKSRSLDVVLKHGFAPKEQYTRHGRQGAFTDVYTVGASFYFAITGKRPPDSIERMDEDKLIPPSSLGVKIAPEKEDAILTAMSVQAANRYQTMVDFRKALMRAPEAELQNAAHTASMPQYVPQPVYVPQKPKDIAAQSQSPQGVMQTEAADSVLKTEPVKAKAAPTGDAQQQSEEKKNAAGASAPMQMQPMQQGMVPQPPLHGTEPQKTKWILPAAIGAGVVAAAVIIALVIPRGEPKKKAASYESQQDQATASHLSEGENQEIVPNQFMAHGGGLESDTGDSGQGSREPEQDPAIALDPATQETTEENIVREETIHRDDGSYFINEYDANGNVIKRTGYDADGALDHISELDANGNLIKWTAYNADGTIDYYSIYEYDANGNCIKFTMYNADGTIGICEYDANGNLIKGIRYNADGTLDYIIEYDENGNAVKIIKYNADGSINYESSF